MNVGLKFKSVVRRKATAFNIVFDFILLPKLLAPYLRQPFVQEQLLVQLPVQLQEQQILQVQQGRLCGLHRPAIWQRKDTKEI